jgi:hypothetical protein
MTDSPDETVGKKQGACAEESLGHVGACLIGSKTVCSID